MGNGGFGAGHGMQQTLDHGMGRMGGTAGGRGKDRFMDPNNVSMMSIPK
jgi:hypothetical protein